MRYFTVITLIFCTHVWAQQIGDTPEQVKKSLGSPAGVRDTGKRQIWIYSDGSKIVFVDGKVAESRVSPKPQKSSTDVEEIEVQSAKQKHIDSGFVSTVHPVVPKQVIASRQVQSTAESKKSSGYGILMIIAGGLVVLVCEVMILIEGFSQSVMWGIGMLIFPISKLFFVALHWTQTKKPFLVSLFVGFPLIVLGAIV